MCKPFLQDAASVVLQRRSPFMETSFNTSDPLSRQQDNNSSRKQIQSKQKIRKVCILCFWRKASTKGEHGTLQCSAGPEWYGCHGTFGTLASTWAPEVGRPVKVRWVPRSTQKTNSCGQVLQERVMSQMRAQRIQGATCSCTHC